MTLDYSVHLHDPKDIKIRRDERQRKIFTIDDLELSIPKRGLINPITVRVLPDQTLELVAGERRLTTFLSHPELGQIPCRYLHELSDLESQIIELEENLKRQDLSWPEYIDAILTIHDLYVVENPEGWTIKQTGEQLGYQYSAIFKMLDVAKEIRKGNEKLTESSGWTTAYQVIENMRQRQKEAAEHKLDQIIADDFKPTQSYKVEDVKAITEVAGNKTATEVKLANEKGPTILQTLPLLNLDFIKWAKEYQGTPFNFLHMDLPYGINIQDSDQAHAEEHGTYEDTPEVYWELLNAFTANLDKLVSSSAHIIFWHSPKMGEETRAFFERAAPDLWVQDIPLVWLKSDNRGIIADAQRRPRNITEFAFLITRGDRKLLKSVANAYAAPTSRLIHQAEKPVPVLKHFFQMFVDEHTRMLDPTAGSANSLQACLEFNPTSVLGIEKDPDFFERSALALKKYLTLKALSEKNDD